MKEKFCFVYCSIPEQTASQIEYTLYMFVLSGRWEGNGRNQNSEA